MLTIYRSRESVDKEKFIFESAAQSEHSIVIVPDQYTLAAERQAMDRLETDVLFNIEITGISHLGTKLLEESGTGKLSVIDRYGRHMLISKILRELDDELVAFKGFYGRETFVEAINDFISAAKQHEISPEALDAFMGAKAEEDETKFGAFRRKLHDMILIYRKYQESLKGKYTDNEDLIDLYINAAAHSETLAESHIWVYGFDSFTPKNIAFLIAIAGVSPATNVHLIYDSNCRDEDLFTLSGRLTDRFLSVARDAGIETKVIDMEQDGETSVKRAHGIKTLEKELFAVSTDTGSDSSGIEITRCANIYNEAEAAAAFVLRLLREENYRLSDIVMICNDQEVRSAIIGRVFREYGLDIFDDRKRDVLSSPIAIYVTALMDSVVNGYRTPDIMRLIKTGLTPLTDEDVESLENYVFKYSIKGNMWNSPFIRGAHESIYSDGKLEELEDIRRRLMEILDGFKAISDGAKTYGDFADAYQKLISEDELLNEKIEDFINMQIEAGLADAAEESVQIWDAISALMTQLKEIMNDEPFDGKEFSALFKSGLSQIEVGVLPPTVDDILLGTMQRTRSGDAKALLVIGANDNLIPRIPGEEILFSREELSELSQGGQNLGMDNDLRLMEENVAIYRNLSKPSEHLWISYSLTDETGGELRPSEIINSIKEIFPALEISEDPILSKDITGYIGGHINTLRHYADEINRGEETPEWRVVSDWLKSEDFDLFSRVEDALRFDNVQTPLSDEITSGLYAAYLDDSGMPVYKLSPTSLERYSRCPFSYFVGSGLRAQELRGDLVGGREIGDLYHSTLQKYTEKVSQEIGWESISKEESDALIEEITAEWAEDYRSSLFMKSKSAEYRLKRAVSACKYVAWALVNQAREGEIKESYLEAKFDYKSKDASIDEDENTVYLEPIVKELSNGKAIIRGKIDRVDILKDDRVKIIDYKTGHEKFDKDEASKGYRLQLMLYLEAAQEKKREPAGVFYFLIKEPEQEGLKSDAIEEKIEQSYRMDGIILDDDTVIREVAGEFDKKSKVLKLTKTSKGVWDKWTENNVISEEDLKTLQNEVSNRATEICQGIANGEIPLTIKVSKKRRPCDNCDYRGICRFDLIFDGCREKIIKK